MFGAVVHAPNSNLSVGAGNQPPHSNSLVVNVKETSDNGTVNSELLKNGNNNISIGIVNSELLKNDDNDISDIKLLKQGNNDISSMDNNDINENKYETSSEGLSSDGEISEDESELEAGIALSGSHSNLVSPGSSDFSAPSEHRREGQWCWHSWLLIGHQ